MWPKQTVLLHDWIPDLLIFIFTNRHIAFSICVDWISQPNEVNGIWEKNDWRKSMPLILITKISCFILIQLAVYNWFLVALSCAFIAILNLWPPGPGSLFLALFFLYSSNQLHAFWNTCLFHWFIGNQMNHMLLYTINFTAQNSCDISVNV